MTINFKSKEQYILVFPEGRLDLNTSQVYEKELLKIIEDDSKHLVISFRYIDYLHSSGIRLIITIRNRLLDQGNQLILCEINDSVEKIINFVDLSGILRIFSDEDEAAEYIQSL